MAEYRIRGLKKSFQINGGELNVLNGLDLNGEAGEITVILGKSGCGKTTLLKLICGLEKPDAGSIDFPKGMVGMVFQEPRLMPWLTCTENIAFGLKKKEIKPEEIDKLVQIVGLKGFENAHPAQLSGGMQQRVALARALACQPSVILMDEPFAALDYFTRDTMQKELLRIHNSTHMGAIFVTHNVDEAVCIGDRICVMSDGKIAKQWHSVRQGKERDALSAESIELKRSILYQLNNEQSFE